MVICTNPAVPRMAVYGAKTVLFGAVLSGREEATARLRGELQVDEFEIVHTDFEMASGEYAFGDICWNALAQKWTWQILPDYPLSRLNIRK